MPARRIIQHPVTRKFISEEQAREIGGFVYDSEPGRPFSYSGTAEEVFATPEEPEPPEIFWTPEDTKRGFVWHDFAGDVAHDFSPFAPPEGYSHYRIVATVAEDDDYPRGHATSEWIDMAAWPPALDMVKGVTATGFKQVFFDRQ